jgi:hypothetical protein
MENAVVETLKCGKCGKDYQGVKVANMPVNLCDECYKNMKDRQREDYLNKLRNGKSLEERVAFLEKFVYDKIIQSKSDSIDF